MFNTSPAVEMIERAIKEGVSARKALRDALVGIAAGLVFSFVGGWAMTVVAKLVLHLAPHQPLFVVAALATGLLMYLFKLLIQPGYGLFAIGFGVACSSKIIHYWPQSAQIDEKALASWVALGSAIYVVARGTEDVHKGWRAWFPSK